MKKVRGLKSTNWLLQNSHGDINYSIGNIVKKSQIVLYQLKSVYFFPFNITNLIVETLKFLRRKFHFTSSYKLSVTTWVWMA